ncbi:MAG: adenine deaminase [Clostridia bacterium]|nr:adenine deaminase [Clostridia bacterium]
MINTFCRIPLWECSRDLTAVAVGAKPADLVIQNARLINVCTNEILRGMSVAVACGRIALVGDASHCIGPDTVVVDAQDKYLAPGFLDGHIHVESSMMGVGEYARAVIPHGTVGIYMDPHEICNVLGLDGIRYMLDDAKRTPLKAMLTTPSCVPAVPGFEDTGSFIGPEEVAETMKWKECVGLGEMMNFPGILSSTEHAHGITGATLEAGKIVTGHYSMPETGSGLNGYIAAGVRCCHESTRAIDALEKMRRGMYAMFREGSAWHDLMEVVKSITHHHVDTRFAVLCSDDTHPHTLETVGHLDHIVRRAIEEGTDPVVAFQMVTLNCAQCFQMDHELGSIAPGKCADMVLIDDIRKVHVTKVWIDGELVAQDGKMLREFEPYRYPEKATHSMHVKGTITPETFRIPASKDEVTVRAMEIIPAKVGTFERHIPLSAKDGLLCADPEQDLCKVFVFERHHETGTFGKGFVKGFGIRNGAMASTVAHDAHNLLVVGTNDEDMALAANTLIACGGGMVAVSGGKVLGLVELPVAGLMSEKTLEEMSAAVKKLDEAWKTIGCDLPSPFMTMALLALACLPELRLTNRGLVDCTKFCFVPLEVEDE